MAFDVIFHQDLYERSNNDYIFQYKKTIILILGYLRLFQHKMILKLCYENEHHLIFTTLTTVISFKCIDLVHHCISLIVSEET